MVALIPQENTVAALVARTGRHLQRYSKGRRQVVGLVFLSLSLRTRISTALLVIEGPSSSILCVPSSNPLPSI